MEKQERLITTMSIIFLILIVLSVTVGSVSGKMPANSTPVPKIVSNAANPAYSGLTDTVYGNNTTQVHNMSEAHNETQVNSTTLANYTK
jgi:hypothetical protein